VPAESSKKSSKEQVPKLVVIALLASKVEVAALPRPWS
jgi:hypothetical protein